MPRLQEIAHQQGPAAIGLAVGSAFWGLLWVPIRAMEHAGLPGAWPGFVFYCCAVVLMVPILIILKSRPMAHLAVLIPCGLLTGAAFSLYSSSLVLTDVVRAVLLFYLSPIWSTLLGLIFLGERLTPSRIMALVLGLAGLAVIMGGGALSHGANLGDILALLSGILWAFGSFFLFRSGAVAVAEQVFSFVFGAFLVSGVFLLFWGSSFGGAFSGQDLRAAAPWAVITGFIALPMLFLTIWPATILPPARVGLLMMGEIVVGVITAAIWSGDPFGWREATGCLMIASAGFVEVLGHRSRS
ncbi:DMT family transporter [Nioella aestuarii]|uniref:DMT family transporter n=1 Tax=Nioella aestuarii TaxID=1662864 RepID=UPI003D7FC3D6